MIYSPVNALKVSRETTEQNFKGQEDILKHITEYLKEKENMFSS